MNKTYEFTLSHYREILQKAKAANYTFVSYKEYDGFEGKSIILRHDIDLSLEKAVNIAKIEKEERVVSTYFLMLSSEFYNLLSPHARQMVQEIRKLGHHIGLHFDPTTYSYNTKEELERYIQSEVQILSDIVQEKIDVLSFHRPSQEVLVNNYQFEGLVNTYSNVFFKEIKYISDSRKRWREETIDEIIEQKLYDQVQLLIHPIWWEEANGTFNESIVHFIEEYNQLLFGKFSDNISNFPVEIKEKLDSIKLS